MSRGTWNRIKKTKFFYIQNYRILVLLVIFSGLTNIFLGLVGIYIYSNRPAIDFYATSGITPPIKLTPRDTPNYSQEALLPPDPTDDDGNLTFTE